MTRVEHSSDGAFCQHPDCVQARELEREERRAAALQAARDAVVKAAVDWWRCASAYKEQELADVVAALLALQAREEGADE